MPKPTKPRYGCYNCLYDGKGMAFCTICRVEDKDTVMPSQWRPVIDLSKWSPTADRPVND